MLLWRYTFVKCIDFQISNSQRVLSAGRLRTDVTFALPKGLFKSRPRGWGGGGGGGGGEHVPTCLKYHLLASPTLYILCSKLLYYQPVHLYNENERIPIWALFLSDLPRTFPGSLPCLMLQVPAAWYW